MSVPTITSVSPVAGHTGGRTLVEIDGSNFRIPVASVPVDGVIPDLVPSVSVTFGGVAATSVMVVSATLLYCVTPIHDPGAVDIVVQNLDSTGTAIGGETVTRAAGFTFQLPDLTVETDLVRCIRTLILDLKRQITPNVSWPAHTDFDDTTGDTLSITKLPVLPGLVLASLSLDENSFFAVREPVEVPTPGDDTTFTAHAPPETVDIVFTLVGLSDNSVELLNLTAATKRYFKKNVYLEMLRDPADSTKGTVSYEMDTKQAPDVKLTTGASQSNVKHFAMTVTVRGFDIEGLAGIPLGGPGEGTQPHEDAVGIGRTDDLVVLEPTGPKAIS